MIDVITTQRIKPGKEAEAEAILREIEQETLANEPGALRYEWYRSSEPQTRILLERWIDQEAINAHFRTSHMIRLLAAAADLVPARFQVTRLTRLD